MDAYLLEYGLGDLLGRERPPIPLEYLVVDLVAGLRFEEPTKLPCKVLLHSDRATDVCKKRQCLFGRKRPEVAKVERVRPQAVLGNERDCFPDGADGGPPT